MFTWLCQSDLWQLLANLHVLAREGSGQKFSQSEDDGWAEIMLTLRLLAQLSLPSGGVRIEE